jgi:hypothetical protein
MKRAGGREKNKGQRIGFGNDGEQAIRPPFLFDGTLFAVKLSGS